MAANYLSRLENPDKDFIKEPEIDDSFHEEHLYSIQVVNNEDPSWSSTLQIVWQHVLSRSGLLINRGGKFYRI